MQQALWLEGGNVATQLSLFEANQGSFEATSSNKASKHHLVIEPGDPFTITYTMKKRDSMGNLVRHDMAAYSVLAKAYNDAGNTTIPFTAVLSSSAGDAIKDVLTVAITAAQTTQIGINDDYTWGVRFTNTTNSADTFTFLSGNITAKEDTLI